MSRKLRLPSPAMAVALVALFVALSGTAVAAGVPALAKRALTADKAKVADNAKKLAGKTSAAIVSQAAAAPGPASTAAALVTVKTAPWNLNPNQGATFTLNCDAGAKAVAGGWDDPGGWAAAFDNRPSPDGLGWKIFIITAPNAPGAQTGTLYTVCLR